MSKYINKNTVFIGMPIFNGEKFISGAIETLLNQTYEDFKIVISDNCSTDKTGDICKHFARRDSRIIYHKQETNIGSLENFKFLLEKADTTYFMWACHDDRWESSYIQEMVDVLEHNPEVGLSCSGVKIRDLNTGIESKFLTGFTTQKRPLFRYVFRTIQGSVQLIYGVHRTEILRKFPLGSYDFYDEFMGRWYELESSIVVSPKYLHITGTDGKRIPYSLTGEKIDRSTYRRLEKSMLASHFRFAWPILYLWSYIVGYIMRPKW